MEFCAERGLCVGDTHFKHRSLHKYTKVAKGARWIGGKDDIDLVQVKRNMLQYVMAVRGIG